MPAAMRAVNRRSRWPRCSSEGIIRYIPFPGELKGKYQSYTQADIAALRAAGYRQPFLDVEQGVTRYCDKLLQGA